MRQRRCHVRRGQLYLGAHYSVRRNIQVIWGRPCGQMTAQIRRKFGEFLRTVARWFLKNSRKLTITDSSNVLLATLKHDSAFHATIFSAHSIIFSTGLPKLISWILCKVLDADLKIGQISFLPFSLKDIQICKNNVTVVVDCIGLSSNLVNSAYSKILAIYVSDVRIQKELNDKHAESTTYPGSLQDEVEPAQQPKSSHLTISPQLVSLSQITCIHIYNVNIMLLKIVNECLINATVTEVRLEGATDKTGLLANLSISNFTCKLLHHANEIAAHSCLTELSFSSDVTISVDPKNNLKIKTFTLNIQPELDVVLSKDLLSFVTPESKTKKPSTLQQNVEDVREHDQFQRIRQFLPEELKVNTENVIMKVHCQDKNLSLSLQKTSFSVSFFASIVTDEQQQSIDNDDLLGNLEANFQLEDLNLTSGTRKIVTLARSEAKVAVKEKVTEASVTVSTFSCLYHHEDALCWLQNIANLRRSGGAKNRSATGSMMLSSTKKRAGVLDVLRGRPHKLTLELWEVTTLAHFSTDSIVSSGLGHARVTAEGKNALTGTDVDRSVDGLVESWWCHIGSRSLPDNPNRKLHYWGTPVFLGVLLFKLKRNACLNKVESMIDCAQLEWNPQLENLVTDICRCVKDLRLTFQTEWRAPATSGIVESRESRKTIGVSKSGSTPSAHVHATITNINIFANCNKKVSLVLRTDSGSFESQSERLSTSLDGTKLVTVYDSGAHFACVKSSEMKSNVVAHVPAFVMTRSRDPREMSLQFRQHVSLNWSTTDHMTAHHVAVDVLSLRGRLRELFPGKALSAPTAATRHSKRIRVSATVRGTLSLHARLSSKNTIGLNATEFELNYQQGSTTLRSDRMVIRCDDHNVFSFEGVEVSSSPSSCSALRAERAGFDVLERKDNRVWYVKIASVHIRFPYKYNFAQTFAEKTIGIVKWIKFLHKRKSTGNLQQEVDLPPDLWIKIQEFLVEIDDDPFEARLRDNYELLEDEYNESQKRWKMMDLKVNELRKTHLHLPAAKVEELYQSLIKRNAGIYIKRSQQMFASATRARLYTFRAIGVEALALADPTIHGRNKVLAHMRDLDPDSPWPEEPLEFITLWCRMVQFSAASITATLRDYRAPLLSAKDYHVWGMLIGAEQAPNKRAKRSIVIEIGEPWMNAAVESSMTPLKFFHDFSCDIENLTMGYGPCWEPAMAEFNLAADLINRQSADPSPMLPVWDKLRLFLHGRLTMMIQQLTMVLHASLDPYNTTEEVDYTWTDLAFDWTNAKFVLKGNLDVYVRTASKYDDCHFLHFPNLKLVVKLDWQCLGDPNDHLTVSPCAPDKLPEYSSNQKHDSYRAFRSVHLNLAIVMDTKPGSTADGKDDIPGMLFYSNTLKWLDNLKVILSGVTRPTRRGLLFNNCKPPKVSLSRHYKSVRLSLSLHQFEVCYWMSFAKQRGFQLRAQKLALASEYLLALVPIQDGLKHRPQSVWSVVYMNCELSDGEIWLQSAASDDTENDMNVSFRAPVEKSYFLSLSRLSYGREASVREVGAPSLGPVADTPTHRLVVHDLKGLWTKNNRTIVFGLFDSFMKNKLMRHNLSTEALKGFRNDPVFSSPMKSRGPPSASATAVPGSTSPATAAGASTTSPLSRVQLGHAINMLQKLIAEADNNAVVFSEDLSGNTREQILHGVVACQTGDVMHRNWLVELINSQILLKGCETPGYVIISAARAQILQRLHKPVWKDRSVVSKTTWVGSLEYMQYYATVDSGELNFSAEYDDIQWLNVENIVEKEGMVISDLPDLVGSGQGVGGVVSNTVGGGNLGNRNGVQLQRIVSRCGCQFFYASYGESLDPNCFEEVPPLPPEDPEIWKQESAVDSFTLTHHDLNCSTNSLQYAMLLDVVNNVLMYVEPGKREATEKLQRLRFQLQLSSVEDQRRPILLLQNNLRSLISNLRRLEKEMYMIQKAMDDESLLDEGLYQQMESLENQMYETKVQMSAQAEELAMIISCFKELQILAARNLLKSTGDQPAPLRRRSEVCFRHAQWRLTEADGQLGIADIALSNFLYSKVLKIDDSAEHLLELGYIKVTNLLPNQAYKDVLQPTALRGNIPIDRQCALRIFCREKAPVGGISIKEHFEVNVVPVTINLTYQFFKTMLRFCFPEKDATAVEVHEPMPEEADPETASISSGGSIRSSRRKLQHRRTASTEDQDDIEKMKERAEKNKMFLYIKIPEVPVKVSYKGEKEKNIEDVHDFNLVLQTLEYHNVTWTWLDLLLAMKSDSKKALLSQAIKQKLQLKRSTDEETSSMPHEEDKMRLLMGTLLTGGAEKRSRHMFGKLHKPDPK